MHKTIFISGSTDGIGLETAKMLASQGHHVLLHGRNPAKLEAAQKSLCEHGDGARVEGYLADLSRLPAQRLLAGLGRGREQDRAIDRRRAAGELDRV